MKKTELQTTIAAVLFTSSGPMSANKIAVESIAEYKTVHSALTKMRETNLVEKLDDNTYVLTDFAITEFGLFKTSLPPESKSVAKPKYKNPSEIKSVKSNTTEKIDVIEQIKSEVKENTFQFDEIETKPYPFVTDSAIEDFETRAKPINEVEESVAASFDDVSPELKAFIEQDKIEAKNFFAELDDDEINSPSHYHGQTMDVIDVIDDFLTPKMIEGYLIGSVLKYVLRYQKKGGVQSLKKAQWYLNRTVQDFDLFSEA